MEHDDLLEGRQLFSDPMDAVESSPFLDAMGVALTPPAQPVPPPTGLLARSALVNVAVKPKDPMPGNPPDSYLSAGSGVIVSPKGYVVTALHQIQNFKGIMIQVQTPQGPRPYNAKIVKVAPEHNLALLKMISQDTFPYLPIAKRGTLRIGDPVVALGDPRGQQAVRQMGTVARKAVKQPVIVGKTQLTHLIATDAINHWSQSGGPLVNNNNELVGINIVVNTASGQMMGYAIPAQTLIRHFQELVKFPQAARLAPANLLPAQAGPASAGPVNVAMTVPGTEPGAVLGPGVSDPASQRPADRWWQLAKARMDTQLGINVATNVNPMNGVVFADPNDQPIFRVLGYSLNDFAGLIFLGLISGISGGMMTMGGGIIKVTGLMWLFGYGLLLVRPVAYLTNIIIYGAAALRYHREGLVRFSAIKPLIPWAVGGVVVGYFIGNILSKTTVQWLLGIFAVLLSIKMLVEIFESNQRKKGIDPSVVNANAPFRSKLQRFFGTRTIEKQSWDSELGDADTSQKPMHGLLGLPMGLISGILGITGGVIEVPLQRYVAKLPLRTAIANSAVLVFYASLTGSIVAIIHGVQSGSFELQTPLIMGLIMLPGAYVGGLIGAKLTTLFPLNALRWIYAFLMFIIAVRMFVI
ncbi:MAG: TSUP family transporter [Magnetococcales bacterium]|nr:TSUP family transporter [Magnetococcales bacterium]